MPLCDLYCRVIDNYGDAGVCWRLARQLACEYGHTVRLIIDTPSTLTALRGGHPAAPMPEGVQVYAWADWVAQPRPPGDWVIEAFACELPEHTVAGLAARQPQPVWINLEYLSAETWVEGCHGLASTHPRYGLKKTFFFPGFSTQTGGLLREAHLFERRDTFKANIVQQQAFWRQLGFEAPSAQTLTLSLFAYGHPALGAWLNVLAHAPHPVRVCVPEGRMLDAVRLALGQPCPIGYAHTQGSLTVCALPFLAQTDYDRLLWLCDLNAVRGEDSWVRAIWAGKPFFWQIYPQEEEAHLPKLHAFLTRYGAHLPLDAQRAWDTWHTVWNGSEADWAKLGAKAWASALAQRAVWAECASKIAQSYAQTPDLAQNLVLFYRQQVQ